MSCLVYSLFCVLIVGCRSRQIKETSQTIHTILGYMNQNVEITGNIMITRHMRIHTRIFIQMHPSLILVFSNPSFPSLGDVRRDCLLRELQGEPQAQGLAIFTHCCGRCSHLSFHLPGCERIPPIDHQVKTLQLRTFHPKLWGSNIHGCLQQHGIFWGGK